MPGISPKLTRFLLREIKNAIEKHVSDLRFWGRHNMEKAGISKARIAVATDRELSYHIPRRLSGQSRKEQQVESAISTGALLEKTRINPKTREMAIRSHNDFVNELKNKLAKNFSFRKQAFELLRTEEALQRGIVKKAKLAKGVSELKGLEQEVEVRKAALEAVKPKPLKRQFAKEGKADVIQLFPDEL